MGGSQSREENTKLKGELDAANRKNTELSSECKSLQTELASKEEKLQHQYAAAAKAAEVSAEQLKTAEENRSKEVKQRQLAESLRRSDALLAKRLMNAQMRHYQGGSGAPLPGVPNAVEEGAMAASLAMAAQDELQLRQLLMHTAGELETMQQRAADMEQAVVAQRRQDLTRQLWLPSLTDAAITLRSPQLLMTAGVRMPRAPQPGQRGASVSPGLGVIKQFGENTGQGQWGAVGASVLWDAREREVAALRMAACLQPSADKQLALSFDHAGQLTGSFTASRERLTARVHGSVDVNGIVANNRFGIDVTYDVAE